MTAHPTDALGAVHFVGIGGAGMSGIARVLLARGTRVSGSAQWPMTRFADGAALSTSGVEANGFDMPRPNPRSRRPMCQNSRSRSRAVRPASHAEPTSSTGVGAGTGRDAAGAAGLPLEVSGKPRQIACGVRAPGRVETVRRMTSRYPSPSSRPWWPLK